MNGDNQRWRKKTWNQKDESDRAPRSMDITSELAVRQVNGNAGGRRASRTRFVGGAREKDQGTGSADILRPLYFFRLPTYTMEDKIVIP